MADRLLEPPHAPGLVPLLERLRLARDELSTKVVKVESTLRAGSAAMDELDAAIDRLGYELAAAERATARHEKRS